MGAAMVKQCFAGDDVHDGMKQSDARFQQQKTRYSRSSSEGRNKHQHRHHQHHHHHHHHHHNYNQQQAQAQQLKQLELQMQFVQLQALNKHQHQQQGNQGGYHRQTATPPPAHMDYYYAARNAGMTASVPDTPLSVSSASGYSATMSESSFVGSQCDQQPQDDEIMDMVMANAGLAYHPTQQWHRHAPPPHKSPQQQQQAYSTSLPATSSRASSSTPPVRPTVTRRSSMNAFRLLLPDTYTLGEVLGTGTTSTCYRCERRADGTEFACKVIDKRKLAFSSQKRHDIAFQLRREVDVLKRVSHPNIAKLEEAFENDAYLILIMELLDGGELFDAIVEKGRFSEREARQVAHAVLSAMQYMHSLGVVHRDLKPENMLLTTAPSGAEDDEFLNVKIIDFGFAKFMTGEGATTTSFLGTGGYLAPEILVHHPYTSAVDMWAFGVLLYLLLCGRLPFAASTHLRPNQSVKSLYRLTFPAKYWSHVSPEAIDLVEKILVLNPHKRLTATDALTHVWLQ